MDKRYQVFVSSTYADLKEERLRVIQTLMEMDCIPAGMELFPATDEEQFAFIKRVIDDCDYYIVIVGGRYGSTTSEGISYTEKEYDYAVEKGLKVIAFIHENPDDLSVSKSDIDITLREKLEKFRQKLSTSRLVKPWSNPNELPGLVALSLSKTIKTFPATGWVRANRIANEQILSDYNELRKEYDSLAKKIQHTTTKTDASIENLAGLAENFVIRCEYAERISGVEFKREQSINTTWSKIFSFIAPHLMQPISDGLAKIVLEKSFAESLAKTAKGIKVKDYDFETIRIQLKALNLINLNYTSTTKGGMALFWSLTQHGEKVMMEIRTIKSKLPPSAA